MEAQIVIPFDADVESKIGQVHVHTPSVDTRLILDDEVKLDRLKVRLVRTLINLEVPWVFYTGALFPFPAHIEMKVIANNHIPV